MRLKNSDAEDQMNEAAKVTVLLVADSPNVFVSCRRRLERNGCHCEFAECEREVWNVLEQRQFDIVLSVHKGRSGRTESLGAVLSGSQTTLFYALPVERGCWWVPILRVGEECFGAPALRPTEFADALDALLEQVKAGFASRAIPIRMTLRVSHERNSKPVDVPSLVTGTETLPLGCIVPLPNEVSSDLLIHGGD
jgi:hypothetical protein